MNQPGHDHEGHWQRLKQRFDRVGLSGLAEHEMLELTLFYVLKRSDTKPVAKDLLHRFKDLPGVFAAKRENLLEVSGIGPEASRFLRLLSELSTEVVRRKSLADRTVLSSAADLVAYLGAAMANLAEEQFRVVFLDHANAVLQDEILSRGIEDQTAVYPRQVLKRALALHATGILVAHNHPTGQIHPSGADREITRALVAAARTLDIRFLDHLIIGREGKGYFSFREAGLLD